MKKIKDIEKIIDIEELENTESILTTQRDIIGEITRGLEDEQDFINSNLYGSC